MEYTKTNWTKDEFTAYLLVYCMECDCHEEESEIEYIKGKVGNEIYKKAYAEFEKDNDYQSLNKIQSGFEDMHFSNKEKDEILREIHELFEVDGYFHIIERGVEFTLKRLLDHTS